MSRYLACGLLLLVVATFQTARATCATVTLAWTAPTTNQDGSPLTDMAGYSVHWGLASGQYPNRLDVGNVLQATISTLNQNTRYYFVTTALDTSGNRSAYSNEVSILTAPPSPPGTLTMDLAYAFEEPNGITVQDLSGKGRAATLMNGVLRGTGKYGQGLRFDGVNDYLRAADVTYAAPPFTLMLWFQTTAHKTQYLMGKYASGTNQIYLLMTTTGQVMAGLYDGVDWREAVDARKDYADGLWHHAAMVVRASILDLYVDGTLAGSSPHDNTFATNTVPWEIGRRALGAGDVYFTGTMDDVRLYPAALTLAQVQTAMNTPLVGGPPAGAMNLTVTTTNP